MQPHTLTEEEQELADRLNAASRLVDKLDNEMYNLIMKSVKPLLAEGKIEEAKAYMVYMPDGVGRMYVADAIRVARGDYAKS